MHNNNNAHDVVEIALSYASRGVTRHAIYCIVGIRGLMYNVAVKVHAKAFE